MADQTGTYQNLLGRYQQGATYGSNTKRYQTAGATTALAQTVGSAQAQLQAKANLIKMLQNEGRVDPRLLAAQQASNARSTRQMQGQATGAAASRGLGNSGLAAALNASIGSAGQRRANDLAYRDIADSYARNQQNIGLTNETVTRPGIDFAALGANQYAGDRAQKNAQTAGYAGIISGLAGLFV